MTFRFDLVLVPAIFAVAWAMLPRPLEAEDSIPAAAAGTTAPMIVRAIELYGEGWSAAKKKKMLARMHTKVGQPYSEVAIEEDLRLLYHTGMGGRIFGEWVSGGVKIVIPVPAK